MHIFIDCGFPESTAINQTLSETNNKLLEINIYMSTLHMNHEKKYIHWTTQTLAFKNVQYIYTGSISYGIQ